MYRLLIACLILRKLHANLRTIWQGGKGIYYYYYYYTCTTTTYYHYFSIIFFHSLISQTLIPFGSEIPLVLFECGYEDIDWVYEVRPFCDLRSFAEMLSITNGLIVTPNLLQSSDHDHSAKVLHNTHYKDSLIRAAVGWHMWKGMDDVYFPNPACRKRSRRPEKEASSSHSQELPEEFLQWAELKHQSGVRLAGSRYSLA
tara:strand:+ start:2823 stop:3422 length:600 start_codon:yes stop_codon:yes gene_type:complete